jgi:hypothetical protein
VAKVVTFFAFFVRRHDLLTKLVVLGDYCVIPGGGLQKEKQA